MLSNLLADMEAADRITVTGLMTIFRDDKGKLSPPPAKMAAPTALIEFIIQCRKVGDDWRAAIIDINYIFR